MTYRILMVLYLLGAALAARAYTPGDHYNLGVGLLQLARTDRVMHWPDTVPVYRDTALAQLQTMLTADQTTCPECMSCAEPATYYQGAFRPFICGSGKGPAFICTRVTPQYFEIITDTSGARAYIAAAHGRYASWEQYLPREAAAGEYFRIVRQWDSTVLYDKPYPAGQLPAADKTYCVGVRLRQPDDLKFYPVTVQGHWVRLKAMRGKQLAGYCWIIWRDERRLYHWFAWNAD